MFTSPLFISESFRMKRSSIPGTNLEVRTRYAGTDLSSLGHEHEAISLFNVGQISCGQGFGQRHHPFGRKSSAYARAIGAKKRRICLDSGRSMYRFGEKIA